MSCCGAPSLLFTSSPHGTEYVARSLLHSNTPGRTDNSSPAHAFARTSVFTAFMTCAASPSTASSQSPTAKPIFQRPALNSLHPQRYIAKSNVVVHDYYCTIIPRRTAQRVHDSRSFAL